MYIPFKIIMPAACLIFAGSGFAQNTVPITLTINAATVKVNAKATTCKSVTSKYFPADSTLEISTDDPTCTAAVAPGVPSTGADQPYQGTVWAAYESRVIFPAKNQANPLANVNLFFTNGGAPSTVTLTTRPTDAKQNVYVRYKIEAHAEPPGVLGAQYAVDYTAPATEGILTFPGSVPTGFSAIMPVQQQIPITLLYNQQGHKALKITLEEINSGRSQPTKDKILDSTFYIFKSDPVGTTPPVVVPPVVVPPVVVPPVITPPTQSGSLKTCPSIDGNNQPIRDANGFIVNLPCGTDSTDLTIISTIPSPSWTMGLQYSAVTRQPLNAYAISTSAPATNCQSATPPITQAFMHNVDYAKSRRGSARDVFTLQPNAAIIYAITVPVLQPGEVNTGSFSLNVSESFGPQAAQFVTITKTPCDFDTSKVGKDACFFSDGSSNGGLSYRIGGTPGPTETFVPICVLTPGEKYYVNVRHQDARPSSSDPRTTGFPTQDSCTRSLPGTPYGACATLMQFR